MVATSDVEDLDATGLAELVRRGEVRPVELVEAAIARIERLNPLLNAVVIPLFDRARDLAATVGLPDGPFRGVPLLLKDALCHTAGDPYHLGMRLLKEIGWRERSDTYLAARFRAAGFVICGRTNTPELAASSVTEPVAYGPTRNPWDPRRSPAGSSGGSAAAVAAGMVPVAHGNDSAGSIRLPASACGLVGLKPTRGRTTLGPDVGEYAWQTTCEHVLTRSVRDTAAVLDAVAGPAPGDPYVAPLCPSPFVEEVGRDPGALVVGIRTRVPGSDDEAHVDCVAAVEAVGGLLESLGHRVEPEGPPALDRAEGMERFLPVLWASLARELDRWSRRTGRTIGPDDVEPMTWVQAEAGRRLSAPDLIEATDALHGFGREMGGWWASGADLLLTPTMPEPPSAIGEPAGEHPDADLPTALPASIAFTAPLNATGQPAVSLPLCWNLEGLPIGIQLVAAYGREDLLLRVAAQLEEARPWRDRRPPGPPQATAGPLLEGGETGGSDDPIELVDRSRSGAPGWPESQTSA